MVKGTSTGARIGAFFAGFGILRAVALLPGIGVLAWLLVCLSGRGAHTNAAGGGGRGGPEAPSTAAAAQGGPPASPGRALDP
jgi:hypothetical protein